MKKQKKSNKMQDWKLQNAEYKRRKNRNQMQDWKSWNTEYKNRRRKKARCRTGNLEIQNTKIEIRFRTGNCTIQKKKEEKRNKMKDRLQSTEIEYTTRDQIQDW